MPYSYDGVYKLLEFLPIGYAFYHPESYLFVEYSLSSMSPYDDVENICYNGPMEYFKQTEKGLVDLCTELLVEQAAMQNTRDAVTLNCYEQQKQYCDIRAGNYIETGVWQNLPQTRANTSRYVKSLYFFKNLYDFGVNSDDTCGYLAASILLGYYDTFYSTKYINDAYITAAVGSNPAYSTWGNSPSISNDLHLKLIEIGSGLGIGNKTVPLDIYSVLNSYLIAQTALSESYAALIVVDVQMRNEINADKPIITFGQFKAIPNNKKKNHTVVIYGYEIISNVTYYTAHYGWSGYTDVKLANL